MHGPYRTRIRRRASRDPSNAAGAAATDLRGPGRARIAQNAAAFPRAELAGDHDRLLAVPVRVRTGSQPRRRRAGVPAALIALASSCALSLKRRRLGGLSA